MYKSKLTVSTYVDSAVLSSAESNVVDEYVHHDLACKLAAEIAKRYPTEVERIPDEHPQMRQLHPESKYQVPYYPIGEKHTMSIYVLSEKEMEDLEAELRKQIQIDMIAMRVLSNYDGRVQ